MVDFAALAAPFAPDRVSWRVGSTTQDKSKGMALAYIDARDVMERLDAVCGPAGWQNRYSHAEGATVCEIGIRCGDDWVWKADGSGDTDVEKEKGALSGAFKRAAVRWGIGRYLYDLDSPWVKLEAKGRSYIIEPGEMNRLRSYLGGKGKAAIAAPPAAAPSPAEEQEADPYAEIVDNMTRSVNTMTTAAKLDALLIAPRFKGDFDALPPPVQARVNSVIDRRKLALNPMGAG